MMPGNKCFWLILQFDHKKYVPEVVNAAAGKWHMQNCNRQTRTNAMF